MRRRGYKLTIDNWNVHLCPSRTPKSDLFSCWNDVLSLANESSHGGAHILAFHNVWGDHEFFDAKVYGRHRLVWLDSSDLATYGTEAFAARIQTLAKFEETWRDSIRPKDPRSPLLLPEPCFEPKPDLCGVWRQAHKLRRDRGRIAEVVALIERFREDHYSKGCWVDDGGRVFDPGATRHAIHVPPGRRWKFAFEIPPGFHFDVRMRKGGDLSICDSEGVRYRFTTYTNVDCHGHIRGGF